MRSLLSPWVPLFLDYDSDEEKFIVVSALCFCLSCCLLLV